MKDSVTYQATVREGEIKSARHFVVRHGTKTFGFPPDSDIQGRLEAIEDVEELKRLFERVTEVSSWRELVE